MASPPGRAAWAFSAPCSPGIPLERFSLVSSGQALSRKAVAIEVSSKPALGSGRNRCCPRERPRSFPRARGGDRESFSGWLGAGRCPGEEKSPGCEGERSGASPSSLLFSSAGSSRARPGSREFPAAAEGRGCFPARFSARFQLSNSSNSLSSRCSSAPTSRLPREPQLEAAKVRTRRDSLRVFLLEEAGMCPLKAPFLSHSAYWG